MRGEITARIFLVGCPRSGTTLLQSLLAANSHLASFPETHFYERLFSGRPLLAKLDIAARRARPHWRVFLEEIGHPEMAGFLPRYSLRASQYSKAFVRVLDTLSMDRGKHQWLEKTPGHLRRIDQIEELVERVRFVHITRNGEDNIASLFEVGNKYPETWFRWYGTLEQCTQRWVTDIRISQKYVNKENHRIVQYEELIANPRAVIRDLCDFLGLPFEGAMLLDYSGAADRLILKSEIWKTSVHEPIWSSGKRRFYDFLNAEQRQTVRDHIPEDVLRYFSIPGSPDYLKADVAP